MRSRNLASQILGMGRRGTFGPKYANLGARSAHFGAQVMLRERSLRHNSYVVTHT